MTSKNEIIYFFNMYKTALSKEENIAYLLYSNKNDLILNEKYIFYHYITKNVREWLSYLSDEEKQLIDLRYNKKLTLTTISSYIGYASHSTVYKNLQTILTNLSHKINSHQI